MTRKRMLSYQRKFPRYAKRFKPANDKSITEEAAANGNRNTYLYPVSGGSNSEIAGDEESESVAKSLLEEEISEIREQIAASEKHQRQTTELRDLIVQWKEAGLKTIDALKEQLTGVEIEQILLHFQIDPRLFDLDSLD